MLLLVTHLFTTVRKRTNLFNSDILSEHQMITKWSNYIIVSKYLKTQFLKVYFQVHFGHMVLFGAIWLPLSEIFYWDFNSLDRRRHSYLLDSWEYGPTPQRHDKQKVFKSFNSCPSFFPSRYCWLFEGPGPRSQYQGMQRKSMSEAGARLFYLRGNLRQKEQVHTFLMGTVSFTLS